MAAENQAAGSTAVVMEPDRPYPGLRPFKLKDAPLFFGRSKERVRLLELLEQHPFLAVLGSSGSGKSSLVLSGLLPDIASGKLLTPGASEFSFTDFRPGSNPYAAFAEALWRGPMKGDSSDPLFIEERLRRSPLGLCKLLLDRNNADQALVVVVDQFEEFFRFAGLTSVGKSQELQSAVPRDFTSVAGDLNEAQAFVDLLLASCHSKECQVFVVLTMRSDFYKHCEVFEGLPEMIAARQYLAPRMGRRQLEDAIRLPLRTFGWAIEDELVNWMLNDVHGEYDQLPILQHALSRMWSEAVRQEGEPTLKARHYVEAGKLGSALNWHGRELVANCGVAKERVSWIFRSLGDFDPATGASIRRPRTLAQLVEESGVDKAEVSQVVNFFRGAEHCFLMPPPESELKDKTVIDLTHECLLRKWEDLNGWMDAERTQGRSLVRLKERADDLGWDWKGNSAGGHLNRVEIQRFREAFPASAAVREGWGERYQAAVPDLLRFLAREERWLWLRLWGSAAGVAAVLCLLGGWWFQNQQTQIKIQETQARMQSAAAQADEARALAEKAKAREDEARAREDLAHTEAESLKLQAQQRQQQQQQQQTNQYIQSALGSQGETAARMADLESVAKTLLDRESEVPAELKPQLRRLGLIDKPDSAPPPPISDDFRVPSAMTLGPYNEAVSSVAFSGSGTPSLALVVGADRLRSRGLFQREETEVWNQSARTMSVSTYADSPGWIVATNGGPDFARFENDSKWISVNAGVPVVRGRWIGGKAIVFCTTDGRIGLWPWQARQPVLFKTEHRGTINDVVGNATSTRLLSSGDDGLVILWSVNGDVLKPLGSLPAGAPVRSASFSPDGKRVLLPAGERVILLLQLPDDPRQPLKSSQIAHLGHDRPVVAGAFSPDGKWLATADSAGSLYLWDATERIDTKRDPVPETTLRGHPGRITAMAWAPGSEGIASADDSGTVVLWRLNFGSNLTATPVPMPSHRSLVDALAWAADESGFATGSADGTARVHPTRVLVKGGFKTFGGPEQKAGGDLALVAPEDVASATFASLFLPGGASLLQRLNPETAYLAVRWDYTVTPKAYLQDIHVRVRNLKTGESELARPVDWGPNEKSGKAADLSPGLAKRLGLGADDEVEIEIPLLAKRSETTDKRMTIARQILDWEAQRDSRGNIEIQRLPAGDPGGKFKVAGFSEKYHPGTSKELLGLINSGRPSEAETAAVSAIAAYTDRVTDWVSNPGIEAFMRDTLFRLGPADAAKVLQLAVNVIPDGVIGAQTLGEIERRETAGPVAFLQALVDACQVVGAADPDPNVKRISLERREAAARFSLNLIVNAR